MKFSFSNNRLSRGYGIDCNILITRSDMSSKLANIIWMLMGMSSTKSQKVHNLDSQVYMYTLSIRS